MPLVVPEVNADAIAGYGARNIIANPNCSTIQMVVALKPLHDHARIKRIVVATYQSTSGAGKKAMDELFDHTRAIYMNSREEPRTFAKTIAFNVVPQIGPFDRDGSTGEEVKMVRETQRILDPEILVSATCVRVPTFIGHAEAVNVEFHEPITEGGGAGASRRSTWGGGDGPPRGRRLRHPGRLCGGRRDLCVAHPPRSHGGERALPLDRLRQSAQGGGAERGPDRRGPDRQPSRARLSAPGGRPDEEPDEGRDAMAECGKRQAQRLDSGSAIP